MKGFIWLCTMLLGLGMSAHARQGDSVAHGCGAIFSATERVSFPGKSYTLEEAVKHALKNRSPYLTPKAYTVQKKVTMYIKDASVPEVMDIIEEQYGVYFFVDKAQGVIAVDFKAPFIASGVVRGPRNLPLPGANVYVKGTHNGVTTNLHGQYYIALTTHDTIGVSYADMIPQEVVVDSPNVETIYLQEKPCLNDVVINDGYLPKSKKYATGAYQVPVITHTRYQPSFNYLQRYNGLIPSFAVMEDRLQGITLLSVRGKNSLAAYAGMPPIIDQFPVQVNTSFFNPDDIQQTIVIKDAAASVIYGSKGGNGAIASTTFQVPYKDTFGVSLTTQWTITQKPRTGYQRGIAAGDYLDLEDTIFSHLLNPRQYTLSPAQDIYYKRHLGLLAKEEAKTMINALRSNDLAGQVDQYFNRHGLLAHHSVSAFAGSKQLKGYASLSWDDHQMPEKNQDQQRITMMVKLGFKKDHLELEGSVYHALLDAGQNAYQVPVQLPYLLLTNAHGDTLSIPYQTAPGALAGYGSPFLDWKYYPLKEAALMKNSIAQRLTQFNVRASYSLFDSVLIAEALWQSVRSGYDDQVEHAFGSFFTRDLINRFNQGGHIPIPLGSILDRNTATTVINNLRGQLNFAWKAGPVYLTAYGGAEKRLHHTTFAVSRIYGNDIGFAEADMNYVTPYNVIGGSGAETVPHPHGTRDSADNYMSYYFNSNMHIAGRFNLSFGIRKDMTNHLSAQSNKNSDPLWAIGTSWSSSGITWRATYGQTGNMDYGVASFTTVTNQGTNNAGTVTSLNQVPAGDLKYERLSMFNGGVDLVLNKRWLTASVDGYYKRSRNLVTIGPGNPTAGNALLVNNSGSISGWGTEVTLRTNSRKIRGRFVADVELVYGYASQVVRSVLVKPRNDWEYMLNKNYQPGKPADAVYAFRYGGLRQQDGAPQGYLCDTLSTAYDQILADTTQRSIVYMGTATPRHYATVIPSITWGSFSLRCMLLLKAGYVFRQRSLNYYAIYQLQDKGTPAYNDRWQEPGDEKFTQVPAVNLSLDKSRDDFYQYSTANVQRGDHLRLQSVEVGYEWLPRFGTKTFFKRWSIDLSFYNLFIIWRANKETLDPDAGTYGLPLPKTATLTINARF